MYMFFNQLYFYFLIIKKKIMRIIKKNNLINILYNSGVTYPVSPNITYMWNFGSLAGICLIIQIITGIFL